MSPTFLNDARRWRDRADEMRSLASDKSDPESRMIMLRLATTISRSRGGLNASPMSCDKVRTEPAVVG